MPVGEKILIHYLFMPYLQAGEHLLWLGESRAPLIRFNRNQQFLKKLVFTTWRIPLLYAVIYPFIPSLSQFPFAEYLYLLDYLWFFTLAILAYFLINELFFIGKEYYAITTKRLLVLRRLLWKSLDAAQLGLLPEFRLERESIRFAPSRIEEKKIRDWIIRIEHHRPDLETLSAEDAPAAYQALQNLKNAILDERAREIGLMK